MSNNIAWLTFVLRHFNIWLHKLIQSPKPGFSTILHRPALTVTAGMVAIAAAAAFGAAITAVKVPADHEVSRYSCLASCRPRPGGDPRCSGSMRITCRGAIISTCVHIDRRHMTAIAARSEASHIGTGHDVSAFITMRFLSIGYRLIIISTRIIHSV